MRRKSLLVGARAPMVGPKVHLERGTWSVEQVKDVELSLRIHPKGQADVIEGKLIIQGPCAVQVHLVKTLPEKREIFLEACQIANA